MKTYSLIAFSMLLLAAACSAAGTQDNADVPSIASKGPDDLVLRITTGGGFVPVELSLAEMPTFSLYGDGRAIAQGPQILIFPPPALPNLIVRRISPDGVGRILEVAVGAGLTGPDRNIDHAARFIADAPTTTFTLSTDEGSHVTSVYAIDFVKEVEGLSAEERSAVDRLLQLQALVGDLDARLPEGAVGAEEQYRAGEIRVHVTPRVVVPPEGGPAPLAGGEQAPADPEPEQPAVEWPLATPLSEFGQPSRPESFRCATVGGEELEALLAAARQANQLSPWNSAGATYTVVLRPLLPDESGC